MAANFAVLPTVAWIWHSFVQKLEYVEKIERCYDRGLTPI